VDPATLEPVADGQPGIARIIDLGNVDEDIADSWQLEAISARSTE